jgi:hypothetical protein
MYMFYTIYFAILDAHVFYKKENPSMFVIDLRLTSTIVYLLINEVSYSTYSCQSDIVFPLYLKVNAY